MPAATPPPDRDDWDEHWNSLVGMFKRNPAQYMRYELIERRLGLGGDGRGRRILDLGCGEGTLLARLDRALPQAELAGFEMSRSGVEQSRGKVPRARLAVADLFHPPAELAGFAGWATDAVCSEVLEHVDGPEEFLRSAATYLAPGARLIVTVPGGPMSAFDRHIGHRRHFTPASIARVLDEAGFQAEATARAGFPFFNLYRLVVIARGKKLAADVKKTGAGSPARGTGAVMDAFRPLFRLNLPDFPLGWQIVATARKP